MEKIQFDKYDEGELSLEEVVLNFLVQPVKEELTERYKIFPEDLRQKNLDIAFESLKKNIIIKTRRYGDDGDFEHLVYVACSQQQIDKFLSFEDGHVWFRKKIKRIKEQGRLTAPVEFEFYQVRYDNRKDIVFNLVKGGAIERDYVVAEDELKRIRKMLIQSAYDHKNHIIR